MTRAVLAVVATVVLGGSAWWIGSRSESGQPAVAPRALPVPARPTGEKLEFRELLDPGPELKPSARALALAGKRVRMVGFMAEMELPPRGGFYLVPGPMKVDEAGGGTADLPLQAVRVVSPSAAGSVAAHQDGPLEVTGILELGSTEDADGRVSSIRVLLDGPATARAEPAAQGTR
jgi:hypothetical protein